MEQTILSTDEVIRLVTPYQERYKIKFIDYDIMQIDGSFHFFISKVHSATEDNTGLHLRADGYSILLFKRADKIHATIF